MSSEWCIKRLGDCCEKIGSGATPKGGKEAYLDVGPVYLIRSQNVHNNGFSPSGLAFISEEQAKKLDNVDIEPGDVLLNITGDSVARVCQALSQFLPARVNQHVAIIRPKSNEFDARFLRYFLASPAQQAYMLGLAAAGATRNALTKGMIESFQVPCPPLPVQQGIAEVLAWLDDRITLLRETNTTYEAIAHALFKSWFVDFDPVHAKMQGHAPEGMDEATAALFPDSFEDSKLGPVPKGWKAKSMGEVSTVGIGKTPPRKEPQWFSDRASDVRWVSIRDMGAVGVYASITSEFLTHEAVDKFNVRVVPDNTVLMRFKLTVGRVALTDGEMTTNEAIAHFKLDEKSPVPSELIYLHLKQFDFSSLSSTSSIADAVNSKTVREIPILVPSARVVAAFMANVMPIFAQIKNAEASAANLSEIRDTLLPRLISGQIQIKEAQRSLQEVDS